MATSENMTWEEWREGKWDREKISKPSEYIPIDEQLKIQNNMIRDLNKPKMGDPSFKIHNDGDLRASKRRLAELETCDLFANSEALKEWNCIHYAIAEYLKTTSPEPNKPLFIYQERRLLEFGDLYEFYDDESYSQELVLIGQGAGKYFGISQDDYDEITKGWEGTVHAYNNVREIKKYPVISPEQIAKKFDIPVTKLVIEGYNKITDEEKKEAIEAHIFNFKQRPMKEGEMSGPTRKAVIVEGDGLLDKEMD